MQNQIFSASGMPWESFVLRDNEIWLSSNKVKSLERFEKELEKKGLVESARSYPLSSITEVSFSQAKESVKIKYQNEKGKSKKVNVEFDLNQDATAFGVHLGERLGFAKSEKHEGKLQPLLINGFLFVIFAGAAISFSMGEGFDGESTSARGRRRAGAALVRLVVETIGTTGTAILCALVAIYFGYNMYNRFRNPAKEVTFTP